MTERKASMRPKKGAKKRTERLLTPYLVYAARKRREEIETCDAWVGSMRCSGA